MIGADVAFFGSVIGSGRSASEPPVRS